MTGAGRPDLARDGWAVVAPTAAGRAWARAAALPARARVGAALARRPGQPGQLRHGGTWFVGLDALPNAPDGRIAGVALPPVPGLVAPATWHPAQLSVIFPGYPGRDPQDSEAAHRYRRDRGAAHLDGLHPVGPDKRRFLREPHGFVLGLPLDACRAAPLLVWPGSHRVLGAALRAAVGSADPATVDLTDAYLTARRAVFAATAPCPVHVAPGGAILLHRHLLHGTDV